MALVTLDDTSCYRALLARDARFDGLFFVGVRTTGVYCRPICPARTPAPDRCLFFRRAAEAERAGFRACFRCRPELAPGQARVDALSRLVRAACARIEQRFLDDHSVDELAGELGVTARHLRRATSAELGLSPVELAQSRRLALAKQLLADTHLSIADVAFAAGFASLRRFNALFRAHFGRAPTSMRRAHEVASGPADSVVLRLDYRPPLDWDALSSFFRARAIPALEAVQDGAYRRVVRIGGVSGAVAVRPDPHRPALRAAIQTSLVPVLAVLVPRLRALFDLDAEPLLVARHLNGDPLLAPSVRARPGLRVPGALDGFEIAVRAIVGQRISVRAATTILGRLVAAHGPTVRPGELARAFPDAAAIAWLRAESLAEHGLPLARARALVELARETAARRIDLSGAADPGEVQEQLQRIDGVGAWTAAYVAMRALGQPNAFVAGDRIVQRALAVSNARDAERLSAPWQPWRAYAVMHLWNARGDQHDPTEDHRIARRPAHASRRRPRPRRPAVRG